MRLHLICTASAAALLASAAWAQDAAAPAQPGPAPAEQAAPSQMDTGGQATTDMSSPAPSASAGGEVSADNMIGRDVYGDNNEELGEVTDVILDPKSREIRKLVIGSGGFLGIGSKTVAIEMDKVEVRPEQGIFVSGLSQEAIKAMPEYDPDASTVSLDKPAPANPAPAGDSALGRSSVPPPGMAGPTARP